VRLFCILLFPLKIILNFATMTNGEMVSSVLNDNKLLTKDSHISRRHVLKIAQTKSKQLLSQRVDEFKLQNSYDIITHIPCLEMEQVEFVDCGIVEFRLCKNIMKSKCKLPETITGRSANAIIYVASLDGSVEYKLISTLDFELLKRRKYVKNKSNFYLLKEGHLYLPDSTTEVVMLDIITMDAKQTKDCGCSEVEDCTSLWDEKFICTDLLEETVRAQTVQEIAGIYSRTTKDENPNLDENQRTATVK